MTDRKTRPADTSGHDTTPKPRLLDRMRHAMRARHYSPRTEKAYVGWIRRFVLFHRQTPPGARWARRS